MGKDHALVRRLLVKFLEASKTFRARILTVNTGVLPVSGEPIPVENSQAIIQPEAEVISQLHSLLAEVHHYVQLAEWWQSYMYGIASNLHLAQAEFEQVLTKRQSILELIQSKDQAIFESEGESDLGYLRWAVVATAEELERLLATTVHRWEESKPFANMAKQFGGPFFESFGEALTRWLEVNLNETAGTLRTLIEEAAAPTMEKTMEALARYLDYIIELLYLFPLPKAWSALFSLEGLAQAKALSERFQEMSKKLQWTYINQRGEMLYLFREQRSTLVRAVLPSPLSVHEWVHEFTKGSKSADELLPPELEMEMLPLALNQVTVALDRLGQLVQEEQQVLGGTAILVQTLQSPLLTTFFQGEENRITIYGPWHQEMLDILSKMRNAISS